MKPMGFGSHFNSLLIELQKKNMSLKQQNNYKFTSYFVISV